MTTTIKRFDAKLYAGVLAYYGLPANWQRVFKQKVLTDRETGAPLLDSQGKEKTTLVSCNGPRESAQGHATWVQVNQPYSDAAITTVQQGKYTYPKKAKNEDIELIANITFDFEYPPDPSISHRIALALMDYLISQGLAAAEAPIEDTGGGDHIVLPILPIQTTKDTAERWNNAVREVVKKYIQGEFDRLVQQAGIKMDLGGYDISRVLSVPGTWRPYRPDKNDCDALKGGYLRRWLAPYVDGRMPERKENARLAELIQDAYERLQAAPSTEESTANIVTIAREDETPEGCRVLQRVIAKLRITRSGEQRYKAAFKHACYLFEVANAGHLNHDHIAEEIYAACMANGTLQKHGEQKVRDTIANARKHVVGRRREPTDTSEVIVSNKQLPEIVEEALEALMLAEEENPTIFVKANGLVKVAKDKAKNRPIIMRMGAAEFRNALTRTAHYYRLKEKGDTLIKVAITPPKDLVEAIVSPEDPSTWPFPVLDAIVGIPVMRPDGSILDKPGYDLATRLYYLPPAELERCQIPLHPTQEDARKACKQILDLIAEFPFSTQASRANAMGAILTPFIRQAMREEDDVPLAVLDAAAPGTGKGLLSSIISLLSTGLRMSVLPAPPTEEEWDKKILTELMEGNTLIAIDNIPGVLKSSNLETVLTSREYKGRVLGLSKSASPENRATWIATGNNLKLEGDLPERCYWIRMVATTSDPETREFKIPDLMYHVKMHRCALVVAILTMIRAWHIAGRPKDKDLKNFRTFTTWSTTVGSILKFSGVEGFLSDRLERKNEIDDDKKQWTTFLSVWYAKYGIKEIPVATLKKDASAGSDAGSDAGSEIFYALPEDFQQLITDKPGSFSQTLGKALQTHAQRRYGSENFYLERGKSTRTNTATWKVLQGVAGDNPNPTHGKNDDKKNNLFSAGENHIEDSGNTPLQLPALPSNKTAEKRTGQPVDTAHAISSNGHSAGDEKQLPASAQKNNEVNASSPIRTLYAELEQYLERCAPGRSVQWFVPGTFRDQTEMITPGAYKDRAIEELGSKDKKRIAAMVNAMTKLLAAAEVQA